MSSTLRFAEWVSWANDTAQTVVVDERRGAVYVLCGAEMAVWDWLALGYPFERVVGLLAALQADALVQAEATCVGLIESWLALGLLESVSHG